MQKVRFIDNYKDKEVGEIIEVSNNAAHYLIDSGYAVLIDTLPARDKMISSKKKIFRRK